MGKGCAGKGAAAQQSYLNKDLRDLSKKHQVQNMSALLKSLESMGVRFQNKARTKGKGKGKGPPGNMGGKGNNPGHNSPQDKPKAKVRNQGGPAKASGEAGAGNGGSSSAPFAAPRPIVSLKGTKDVVAKVLDQKGNSVDIQFICHVPSCFLAHYKQRKCCIACRALRGGQGTHCLRPRRSPGKGGEAPPH
jgi:hypothetical protein